MLSFSRLSLTAKRSFAGLGLTEFVFWQDTATPLFFTVAVVFRLVPCLQKAKPSDAATVTVEDSTPIRIDCDTDSEIASTSATGTSSTCSTHSGSTAAAKTEERSFQLKCCL
ncbi:hypothetical protein BaRGS_00036975 [Batillaria attramentaria]|uniref:Uncharacterized protein n=1 Tax=Batillaria attramentaria TaxID=370345 RepID=A0ABD0J9X6_9CAEN